MYGLSHEEGISLKSVELRKIRCDLNETHGFFIRLDRFDAQYLFLSIPSSSLSLGFHFSIPSDSIHNSPAYVSQLHPSSSPTWLHMPIIIHLFINHLLLLSHHSLSPPYTGYLASSLSVLMYCFDLKR